MRANRFSVPRDHWNKWSDEARDTFNRLYPFLKRNWGTVISEASGTDIEKYAWNISWLAALAVDNHHTLADHEGMGR